MLYQIDWKNNGYFIECSGPFNIQGLHEPNGMLHGDERFDDHKYQVWDFLRADLSRISLSEMNEPVATDLIAENYAPRVKIAFVVTEPHAVSLMRHYCAQSSAKESKWQCRLFDTVERAFYWVGLSGNPN